MNLMWKESDNNLRLNLLKESGDFCPVPGTRAQSKPQICLIKFDKNMSLCATDMLISSPPPPHFWFLLYLDDMPLPIPNAKRADAQVLTCLNCCSQHTKTMLPGKESSRRGGRAVTVTGEHLGLLSRVSWTVSSQHPPPILPPAPSCLLRFIVF